MQQYIINSMPAEWAAHERTLMAWPEKSSLIRPENYGEVQKGYADVARAISQFENVTMLVGADTAAAAKSLCGDGIEFLTIEHNDAWCRDNGPTFLLSSDGRRSAVRWQFNAWGEKYTPYDLDNQVAEKILTHYGVPFYASPLVLEGGSIHTDGQGTLLTTRECLLSKSRNPRLSQTQIEDELKRALGVTQIIWLNRGLFGDETDGHVDNVACFAKPGVILLQTCSDRDDPNYEITQENLEILHNEKDAHHRQLEIIEIPQPPARFLSGARLTLSYLNFYLVNGGVILPIFGGDAARTDAEAVGILREVFPGRRIITVDGMPLVKEGGNVHCVTQQMPAAVRYAPESAR
jgi:agmatine deiminase